MDQDKPDFDDLFEPFELGETPPQPEMPRRPSPSQVKDDPVPVTEKPPAPSHVSTTSCPSCGSENPDYNRHCDQCGARLSRDPLPVAPAPTLRTSPGGRALGVLVAIVLLVGLAALIYNVFSGGGEAVDASSTTSSTPSTVPVNVAELYPSAVDASSYLDDHGPDNLIDGNAETDWNDNQARGVGAWIEFTFDPPVRITEIVFQNLQDDDRFKRNYKIQGFVIITDDLTMDISGRLENTNGAQRVDIASLGTTTLRIDVKSTYLGESVVNSIPYDELALQAVQFFGSPGSG